MVRFITLNHRDQSDVPDKREAIAGFDKNIPHISLNTCNRTEIYWGGGSVSESVLRHLCRVASGLESAIPGETAILGQIKNAYSDATQKFRLSPELNKMFQTAVRAGKRVRTETNISNGAVSYSQAAADIIKRLYPDLRNKLVTIVGVNKLTEDILKFLKNNGGEGLFLSNRNFSKAEKMAEIYGCGALPLYEKNKFMEFTDILLCATSAPHIIIGREDMPTDREITVIDLSFPENVENTVAEMSNVKFFDIKTVEKFVTRNLALRKEEVLRAEAIIEAEINNYNIWISSRKKYCYE